MSRKKKKQQPASQEPTVPDRRPGPVEWLRRGLLGLVTVLIVARPLVLGEDPGLTLPLSDTSNLILTLLWLIATVGWAAWRLLAREGSWHVGLVEAGLLATVVSVFVSVALPRPYIYRHAALLVSWEWLAFFLALFLIRQLATREEDQNRVLAALLASVVSVSAYGLYQYTVELPRLRQSTVTAERASRAVGLLSGLAGPLQAAVVTVGVQTEDEELASQVARRLQEHNHAFATFAHPNSYASFLALLLPALAAATLVRWQSERGNWQTWLTGGCLALSLLALWVTHSRGGLLAVFLVAPLAVWFLRPRGSWLLRLAPLAVLVAGLGVGWLLLSSGLMQKAGGGLAVRKDYWQATADMIADHFWNGVGPGNFGRQYTRYILPQAHETISDPHNFLLELWSTSGFFAAVFLLLTLGIFFWLMRSGPEQPLPESGASVPAKPEQPDTRWEYYIGGMIGLLLGYLLRELSQSPAEALRLDPDLRRGDEMLVRAVIAGVRSVIWFATFALFERVPWSGRVRGLALSAGVAACLANLCVSGGISFPSVAQPLWLVAGLALASRGLAGLGASRASAMRPGMIVPLPLAVGFLLGYWIYVLAPIRASESLAIAAHEAARVYRIEQAHGFRQIKNPGEFLWRNVVQPLRKAVEEDPIDSERRVQLAQWFNELWQVYQRDPRRFPRTKPEPDQFPFEIYETLLEAERIDPLGKSVYMSLYQSFLAFAQRQRDERNRVVQLLQAAEALRRLHERADPRNPRVLYQLAATWREIGEGQRVREYAAQALELNEQFPPSSRRLNVFQESALREWLNDPQGGVKPRPPASR